MSDFVLTPAAKGDLLKILDMVTYRPDTKPLEIVRVLHGKRDVRRLLAE